MSGLGCGLVDMAQVVLDDIVEPRMDGWINAVLIIYIMYCLSLTMAASNGPPRGMWRPSVAVYHQRPDCSGEARGCRVEKGGGHCPARRLVNDDFTWKFFMLLSVCRRTEHIYVIGLCVCLSVGL